MKTKTILAIIGTILGVIGIVGMFFQISFLRTIKGQLEPKPESELEVAQNIGLEVQKTVCPKLDFQDPTNLILGNTIVGSWEDLANFAYQKTLDSQTTTTKQEG